IPCSLAHFRRGISSSDMMNMHLEYSHTVSEVRTHVLSLLDRHSTVLGSYTWTEFDDEFLAKNVESVSVADLTGPKLVDLKVHNLCIHIFSLNDDSPSMLALEEEEELSAANHWLLPAGDYLLDYVSTTIFFSDRNVDSNLIAWNRVVLLHGPPGTGKTSLCKGLAQKLSIRLSGRYAHSQFVEINSHSLFSKWFSESGKLVTKMFQKIQELIDDKDALVFVLIDEVESLTASRSAAQAGTEPSDAIRVVNSVLTQLDQIKRHPNVVILTTSNVTEKIDLAFVDRADIKQYIGPPSASAIFHIYLSCLEELMKRHIIYPRQQLLSLEELGTMNFMESDVTRLSLTLRNLAQRSVGLSGRALRKIPFLAHALYGKSSTLTVEGFLKAMERAVDKQRQEQASLVNCV
uniref:Pachytene checkpoint protein 2 homolog n=2 Tax=Sinocyclocheilus TaxID=75365 RepID=A0A671LKN0_9TELE